MFGSTFVALAGTMAALSVGAPNLVVPHWTFTLGGLSVQFLVDAFTNEGRAWSGAGSSAARSACWWHCPAST